MTMNNKEVTALLREAESRDNLASALKGGEGGRAAKEFKAQRLALEKARGGAKTLAEADARSTQIIALAEKALVDAKAKADIIVAAAHSDELVAMDVLSQRIQQAESREKLIDKIQAGQNVTADKQIEAAEAIDERAADAGEREQALGTRETAVSAREAAATAREAEIRAFDDWRAAAPAQRTA